VTEPSPRLLTPKPSSSGAFVLGGNKNTLAFVNSFRPEGGSLTARLLPLAWTPLGVVIADRWQNVGVALSSLMDWIDKTFPTDDDRAFVAPVRDIELLARIEWHTDLPERLDQSAILNVEDVPEDVLDGLINPPGQIVQCAVCRRLCVLGDFVWKEKQLCAWDFHAQVFGKRGPWRNGAYEARHFETLPSCAYVAPALLLEQGVDAVLATSGVPDDVAQRAINLLLDADAATPHLGVRTEGGFTVLRETPTASAAS
jgi:hypothetical protein